MRNHTIIVFSIVLVVIAVFTGWRYYDTRLKDPVEKVLVNPAQKLQAFTLTDNNNRPFSLGSIRNKWTFLFFGYTSCPDVCPTTLTEMTRLSDLLSTIKTRNTVQFVFVSVDPQRDSTEQLKGFIRYFNEDFIAATGTIEQLNMLTQQISIKHRRLTEQGDDYPVEHSADILLLDPDTRLLARFAAPHYAEEISSIFSKILDQYRKEK